MHGWCEHTTSQRCCLCAHVKVALLSGCVPCSPPLGILSRIAIMGRTELLTVSRSIPTQRDLFVTNS